QAEVRRNLHEHGLAVPADVVHRGPDVVENGFDPLEGGAVAADHDRQLSLLQGADTAGDRRIQHVRPAPDGILRQLTAGCWADGAHVDIDFARTQALQDAVWPTGDGLEGRGVGEHREDHVDGLRNGPRATGPLQSRIEQPLRLCLGAVVSGDAMAGGQQPAGDAAPITPNPTNPRFATVTPHFCASPIVPRSASWSRSQLPEGQTPSALLRPKGCLSFISPS